MHSVSKRRTMAEPVKAHSSFLFCSSLSLSLHLHLHLSISEVNLCLLGSSVYASFQLVSGSPVRLYTDMESDYRWFRWWSHVSKHIKLKGKQCTQWAHRLSGQKGNQGTPKGVRSHSGVRSKIKAWHGRWEWAMRLVQPSSTVAAHRFHTYTPMAHRPCFSQNTLRVHLGCQTSSDRPPVIVVPTKRLAPTRRWRPARGHGWVWPGSCFTQTVDSGLKGG